MFIVNYIIGLAIAWNCSVKVDVSAGINGKMIVMPIQSQASCTMVNMVAADGNIDCSVQFDQWGPIIPS